MSKNEINENKKILKIGIANIIKFFFIFLIIFFFFYDIKCIQIDNNSSYKNWNKNNSNNSYIYPFQYNLTSINYANSNFREAQKIHEKSAIKYGKVQKVISYKPENISKDFFIKNKKILTQKRGAGYWLWKPYFILKTLKELINFNDYLIYADSGSIYIDNPGYLINVMEKYKVDIMPFHLPHKESHWTKRDAFVLTKLDYPKYYDSNQVQATFIVIKKTNFSIQFFEEDLKYAQDERIITDMENTQGLQNYPGFRENRHDQSIFSLLIKKYNIPVFRDPSQFGSFPIYKEFDHSLCIKSFYPQIFYLFRRDLLSIPWNELGISPL